MIVQTYSLPWMEMQEERAFPGKYEPVVFIIHTVFIMQERFTIRTRKKYICIYPWKRLYYWTTQKNYYQIKLHQIIDFHKKSFHSNVHSYYYHKLFIHCSGSRPGCRRRSSTVDFFTNVWGISLPSTFIPQIHELLHLFIRKSFLMPNSP